MPRRRKAQSSALGFSLIELAIIVVVVGILAAIAVPSWFAFIERQRLRSAQDAAANAIRVAQANARRDNVSWRVSFRNGATGNVEYAIYPDSGLELDEFAAGTTWQGIVGEDSNKLQVRSSLPSDNATGVITVRFNFDGSTTNLKTITFMPIDNQNNRYCVLVSTMLGATRLAEGNADDACDKIN